MAIKKLLPLVGIAFVVAVISTAIFYSLFAGRLNGAAPTREPLASLVVAAHDIKPGSLLTVSDLTTISWEGNRPAPKGTYNSSAQVVGKTAMYDIPKGELVMESRLVARDGTGTGIPEGMRAVSVHVSDSSGVVTMLKPGYKVDVQVFASRSAKVRPNELRTILRAIPVLAVSTQPETSSQGYFSAPVVTLLAAARDAEELALADSYARLRITLRNPLEPEVAAAVAEPKAVAAAVQKLNVRYTVRTLEVTDQGFAQLAKPGTPGVSTSNVERFRSVIANGWGRVQSESEIAAGSSRFSYYDLSRGNEAPQARIGLSGNTKSRIRVRPELVRVIDGRREARSVETELDLKADDLIVVSGLDASNSNRRVLVVISRVS